MAAMDSDLQVRATLEKLGTTAVAKAMGLPISTVHGWKDNDKIPGRGKAHDWRVSQFVAAVVRLSASQAS
jgi:hypothetical protein